MFVSVLITISKQLGDDGGWGGRGWGEVCVYPSIIYYATRCCMKMENVIYKMVSAGQHLFVLLCSSCFCLFVMELYGMLILETVLLQFKSLHQYVIACMYVCACRYACV